MTRAEQVMPIHLLKKLVMLLEDGTLAWMPRGAEHFGRSKKWTAEQHCASWNARYALHPALACPDASGHLHGHIFNRKFFAHRVVFALSHGKWPEHSIDHINGCASDNRPANLRDVSHQENHRNQSLRKNNTTGVVGVYRNKRLGKWQAQITLSGREKHLGFFCAKEDAIAARKQAEVDHGFHQNHGMR